MDVWTCSAVRLSICFAKALDEVFEKLDEAPQAMPLKL
jgi:hypothetical protein